MSEEIVSGSCLCGAVKFEIDLPTKWCGNCHCSMCRRAHGAPYVTWIGVEAEHFRLVAGEKELADYCSSAESRRSFCRVCGSPMLFRSTRWAGEVHVARACIPGDIDKGVQAHVFFSDRAGWVHDDPGDGLMRMGGQSGMEPL